MENTKEQTAQEIINESIISDDRINNLKLFYPKIWEQERADKNITKILKKLKGGKKNGK